MTDIRLLRTTMIQHPLDFRPGDRRRIAEPLNRCDACGRRNVTLTMAAEFRHVGGGLDRLGLYCKGGAHQKIVA